MERNINIIIENDNIKIVDDFIEDWIYTVKVINKWYNVYIENSIITFKDGVKNKVIDAINEYNISVLVIKLDPDELFRRNLLKYGNNNNNPNIQYNDFSDKINLLVGEIQNYKKEFDEQKKEFEAVKKELELLKKQKDKILSELYEIKTYL
jgi:hypothetical protein